MSEWRVNATGTTLTFTATQHFPLECTGITYSWNRIRAGTIREQSNNSGFTLTVNSAIYNDIYYLVLSASTTGSCTCVVGPTVSRQIRVLTGITSRSAHLDGSPDGITTCSGTTYTFTVTQTGYITPYYQFKFGFSDTNIGPNSTSNVYITNDLPQPYTNRITCQVTEGGTNNPTLSNEFWISIYPNTTPSVSIYMEYSSPGQCQGNNISFGIQTSANLGSSPTYQWWINSFESPGWTLISGAINSTYVTNSLSDQDQIKLIISNIITGPPNCASSNTTTSNTQTTTINTNYTASVSISVNSNQPIYMGNKYTFTAYPTNGGTTPVFRWYTTRTGFHHYGQTWTHFFPETGLYPDWIYCIMTTSLNCTTPLNTQSDNIGIIIPSTLLLNAGGQNTTDWNFGSDGRAVYWSTMNYGPPNYNYEDKNSYNFYPQQPGNGFTNIYLGAYLKSNAGQGWIKVLYNNPLTLIFGDIYTLVYKYRSNYSTLSGNIGNGIITANVGYGDGGYGDGNLSQYVSVSLPNTGNCTQCVSEWRSAYGSVLYQDNFHFYTFGDTINDPNTFMNLDEVQFYKGGGVIDIDGNNYLTTTIGTQRWMVDNLRTTKYNDGTSISLVTNNASWAALSTGAYCYHDNDQSGATSFTYSGRTYGALYNWYAVNSGLLAPVGWHVATKSDWDTLISYVGGSTIAGYQLKEWLNVGYNIPGSRSPAHWAYGSNTAVGAYNFNALPGGIRDGSTGIYNYESIYGYWWTTTSYDTNNAYSLIMSYSSDTTNMSWSTKKQGCSVLCVQDPED